MTKKRREIRAKEEIVALGDAVTRAIHWAPESLLGNFEIGDRDLACRRLALRVVVQLGGDGWAGKDADRLDDAIAAGIGQAGEGILTTLGEARSCSRKLVDGIGLHIGEKIAAAMEETGARLVRRWTSPAAITAGAPSVSSAGDRLCEDTAETNGASRRG